MVSSDSGIIVYGKSFNQLTTKEKHIVRAPRSIVNLNLPTEQVTVGLTLRNNMKQCAIANLC